MNKKKKYNNVSEPEMGITKVPVKRFNSFEEANENELMHILNETPQQRIAQTVDLILRVYGFTRESLAKRKPINKVFITK